MPIESLYSLYSNPTELMGYYQASEQVPILAWRVYKDNPRALNSKLDLWAKDPETAYLYFLKNRFYRDRNSSPLHWPEGEATIATDPYYSLRYAEHILVGRFPKGEPTIAKSAEYSAKYAMSTPINQRFELGEPAILTDPNWAVKYADAVIEGPWPEAESVIATDPMSASAYARWILVRPWPAAEPVIARNRIATRNYLGSFPSRRDEIQKYTR